MLNLVEHLKKCKTDIEAEAVAVSMKQNHELMEQVRTFIDRVVIEPRGNLPCHFIAYPENHSFRGRQETLNRMEDSLKPTLGEQKCYALYGLGGVGKTQLALKFAYSQSSNFRAIFWIPAQTSGKLEQGLLDAAHQLGIVDSSAMVDQKSGIKSFMTWLRSCKEPWLIVFDNADDFDALKQYWPSMSSGSILITSRDLGALQWTRIGEEISSMSAEDAKEMFFSAIEHHIPRSETNERAAESILQEIGHLPLAISAAAGIIAETECDLADFVQLCEENAHQPDLFARMTPDIRRIDYDLTLETVWNISLQRISAKSMQLLSILTYLDPDAVPVNLFQTGGRSHPEIGHLSKMTTWLQISKELRKHGLCSTANIYVSFRSDSTDSELTAPGISVHRLLLQTVFHRCSSQEKQAALDFAVALLKAEFPKVSDDKFRLSTQWKECHILLPQVEAVLSRCQNSNMAVPVDLVPILCACGRYSVERRSFSDAERLFSVAQQVCQDRGLQDWELAQFVQRSLGSILLESSAFRCEEAVKIFQGVVTRYEKTLEPDDHVLGITYSDLAQALAAKGEYDKAIALCRRGLSIIESIKDNEIRRDNRFHIHHNMARMYEMKRLPDEALRLHLYEGDAQGNGLRQEQSVCGAWNLYAVGNCLQLLKDPRAIETRMKALKIRHSLFGNHYYTAISYHKLGELHLEAGSLQDANESFRVARQILSDPMVNTEAELARTLWYWSMVKDKLLETEEAAKLRKQAMTIRSTLLGEKCVPASNCSNADFDEIVVYFNR
ncbi:unnamed protein product [Clonostachys rosea f. rosea IK726]|uniref:Uncharacterized protein n=1 Tax=Clonostachys rosea f. rosea IK726 TaxID=1349383 RepID=A0ACA9U418_BIOOC|nr:unnamed protein product [Clonostachys rosea f. rosea IK726]